MDKDWKDFYEIYKEVAREGGATVQTLVYIKNKTHALLVCKKDNKLIGGAAIFFDSVYNINIPRLLKIASSEKYLNLQPNNLLCWDCILWAKNNGYKEFDLGGWQINARGHLKGINKFKEKWGSIVYHKTEYPFFRAIGRKIIRNSFIARLLWYKIMGRKIDF